MSVYRPILIAAAVAVTGFVLVWLLGGTPAEPDPLDFCGLVVPEGASFRMEARWWPPGTGTCIVETPGGVREQLYVPWEEWLAIALLAAACGAAVAALTRRRRILAAAGSAALALLALAVVFL
jgi:hypothetical protein